MAWNGRGRGRGRFGVGFNFHAKQLPTVLFPIKAFRKKYLFLGRTTHRYETAEKEFVKRNIAFQSFWKASVYFLEGTSRKSQSKDIETNADRLKHKKFPKRDGLDSFMKSVRFPTELHDVLMGRKSMKGRPRKKVRWNPESDLQKLDAFEKLERENPDSIKDDEENETEGGKNKKKAGDEDENENEGMDEEEEESEYSGDGEVFIRFIYNIYGVGEYYAHQLIAQPIFMGRIPVSPYNLV